MPETPELVYILAASHSGSTLLAMLLGAQPEIVTVGELAASGVGDPARYRCSCRAVMNDCPFWRRVGDAMQRRGTGFRLSHFETRFQSSASPYARRLLRPLHRGRLLERMRDAALALSPTWQVEYPRLLETNRALVETLAELTGRRIVVDSSKSAVRLKYLARVPGLRLRVLRLVRDGRAVALTYVDPERFADARQPALRGGGTGAGRDDERMTISQAARAWRRSNEEAEAALRTMPQIATCRLRYEELCAAPGETIARVRDFLGLPARPATLDFRSREQHVVGNGMRLDDTSEIRLDERWKTQLSREQLAVFEAIAGRLNRRFGYV